MTDIYKWVMNEFLTARCAKKVVMGQLEYRALATRDYDQLFGLVTAIVSRGGGPQTKPAVLVANKG